MVKKYRVELIPETKGYTVYIPAFDGWTEGYDLANALHMATEYIGLMGITYEEMGKEIPEEDICAVEKGGEHYVYVNFDEYRRTA